MDSDSIDRLQTALYCVFAALTYIGILLSVLLRVQIKAGRQLAEVAQRQAFQAEATALLSKGEYAKLKEAAMQREATHPADATTQYFLGMAHLRCNELVAAKACFEQAVKLDANWKKVCAAHLEKIALELKKAKPMLVDNES